MASCGTANTVPSAGCATYWPPPGCRAAHFLSPAIEVAPAGASSDEHI